MNNPMDYLPIDKTENNATDVCLSLFMSISCQSHSILSFILLFILFSKSWNSSLVFCLFRLSKLFKNFSMFFHSPILFAIEIIESLPSNIEEGIDDVEIVSTISGRIF